MYRPKEFIFDENDEKKEIHTLNKKTYESSEISYENLFPLCMNMVLVMINWYQL